MPSEMERDIARLAQMRMEAKMAKRTADKTQAQCDALRKAMRAAARKGDRATVEHKARILQEKLKDLEKQAERTHQADMNVSAFLRSMDTKREVDRMASMTKTMAEASRRLNPQQTLIVTEQYKEQNELFSMNSTILQDAMKHESSLRANEDAVQELVAQFMDDAGVEQSAALNSAQVSMVDPVAEGSQAAKPTAEADQALNERLKILREQPEA